MSSASNGPRSKMAADGSELLGAVRIKCATGGLIRFVNFRYSPAKPHTPTRFSVSPVVAFQQINGLPMYLESKSSMMDFTPNTLEFNSRFVAIDASKPKQAVLFLFNAMRDKN